MELQVHTRMVDYLQQQAREGANWTVVAGYALTNRKVFDFSHPSIQATEMHCILGEHQQDSGGEWTSRNLTTTAIQNALCELEYLKTGKISFVADPMQIKGEIEAMDVKFRRRDDPTDIFLHLALGQVVLAAKPRAFIPENHISGYRILFHRNENDGAPADLSHYFKVLDTVPDYERAIAQFKARSTEFLYGTTPYDKSVILVGEYKGAELQFNRMGHPQMNTGIILREHSVIDGELSKGNFAFLWEDQVVDQWFFLRYNAIEKRIETLDDRLQPILPGQHLHSYTQGGDYVMCYDQNIIKAARKELINKVDQSRPREVKPDDPRPGLGRL